MCELNFQDLVHKYHAYYLYDTTENTSYLFGASHEGFERSMKGRMVTDQIFDLLKLSSHHNFRTLRAFHVLKPNFPSKDMASFPQRIWQIFLDNKDKIFQIFFSAIKEVNVNNNSVNISMNYVSNMFSF